MIFTGKRVALIGPAPISKDYRDVINSCEIVVRINQALPVPKEVAEVTTDRCDVLYIWRKVRTDKCWEDLKEIRLKPDAIFAEDWYKGKHGIYKEKLALVDPEHFYKLSEQLGTRVNTGMVAISEIASHNPSFLFITGITFYQTSDAYYKGYVSEVVRKKISMKNGNFARHRQRPQLRHFVANIYPMPFLKCDDVLDKICKRYSFQYL